MAMTPQALSYVVKRLKSSTIFRRLVRGLFWSVSGAIVLRGLNLVAMIIIARLLGKVGYGELGMIQATAVMFGVLAGFNIGLTNSRFVAKFKDLDPARASRVIVLSWLLTLVTGGLVALFVLVAARPIAEHGLSAPHLAPAVRIGAVLIFLSALNGTQLGALNGFEAFKLTAKCNLLLGIFSLPVLAIGTYAFGLIGALWALVINLMVGLVLYNWALRCAARKANVPLVLRSPLAECRIIWTFGVPALLAGAMTGPANWYCFSLLTAREGGYAEMGLFSAANQWHSVLLFIPIRANSVILPIMSQQEGVEGGRGSFKTLLLSMVLGLAIVLPLLGGMALWSPSIMAWYGEEFRAGWLVLIIVLGTVAVEAARVPLGSMIVACGQMWTSMAINMVSATILIALTMMLLEYGARGIAGARLLAGVVWLLALTAWAAKHYRSKIP